MTKIQEEDQEKWEQLGPFLKKVTLYADLLRAKMEEAKKVNAQSKVGSSTVSSVKSKPAGPMPQFGTKPKSTRGNKRALIESDTEEPESKRSKTTPNAEETAADEPAFTQPALVTGAKLKDYQLEGVAWMTGLFQNGISGILGTNISIHSYAEHILIPSYSRRDGSWKGYLTC